MSLPRPAFPGPWWLVTVLALAAACDPPPTSIPPGPSQIVSGPVVERPLPPPTTTPMVDLGDAGPSSAPDEPAPAEPPASGTAGTDGNLVRDGGACDQAIECASGICEGQGCGAGQKGVCMSRNRRCTRDLRTYCGCDGKTFRGSGSCPGRRFESRGACK
jgi:hypothetical protein